MISGDIFESILQWGVAFESGSNCAQCLLCEHTHTNCNAKIVNSIVAPNTGISSGECNSSLVGPFIGFHHNSVLISGMCIFYFKYYLFQGLFQFPDQLSLYTHIDF